MTHVGCIRNRNPSHCITSSPLSQRTNNMGSDRDRYARRSRSRSRDGGSRRRSRSRSRDRSSRRRRWVHLGISQHCIWPMLLLDFTSQTVQACMHFCCLCHCPFETLSFGHHSLSGELSTAQHSAFPTTIQSHTEQEQGKVSTRNSTCTSSSCGHGPQSSAHCHAGESGF